MLGDAMPTTASAPLTTGHASASETLTHGMWLSSSPRTCRGATGP